LRLRCPQEGDERMRSGQRDKAPVCALLRLREVAKRCDVSLRTVQGWVASGRLEVLRLSPRAVRVTEEALARFLDRAGRK
jgi:excisionase family DNA binding protein